MREENYPVPPTDQGTTPHGTNRRALLTGTALTAVGIATAGTLASCATEQKQNDSKDNKSQEVKDAHSFFGEHQSGISTEVQDRMYFVALTLKTTDKEEIKKLFKDWTAASQIGRAHV